MFRLAFLCLFSVTLTGCLATKAVTTAASVATKATVLTVKTTAKVATGTAGLLIPNGDEDGEDDGNQDSDH